MLSISCWIVDRLPFAIDTVAEDRRQRFGDRPDVGDAVGQGDSADRLQRVVQKVGINLRLQRPYLRPILLALLLHNLLEKPLDAIRHAIELIGEGAQIAVGEGGNALGEMSVAEAGDGGDEGRQGGG